MSVVKASDDAANQGEPNGGKLTANQPDKSVRSVRQATDRLVHWWRCCFPRLGPQLWATDKPAVSRMRALGFSVVTDPIGSYSWRQSPLA
jgi:hypothetical protein